MRDIHLLAPLNRGKIDKPAGEIATVPDGLAARLIENGRAVDPADAPAPDPKPAKPAAKGKGKPEPDPE